MDGIYLFVIVVMVPLYFLPTIVMFFRHLPDRICAGIFLLNLFAGWTMIGWVGALVWAAAAPGLGERR